MEVLSQASCAMLLRTCSASCTRPRLLPSCPENFCLSVDLLGSSVLPVFDARAVQLTDLGSDVLGAQAFQLTS